MENNNLNENGQNDIYFVEDNSAILQEFSSFDLLKELMNRGCEYSLLGRSIVGNAKLNIDIGDNENGTIILTVPLEDSY